MNIQFLVNVAVFVFNIAVCIRLILIYLKLQELESRLDFHSYLNGALLACLETK